MPEESRTEFIQFCDKFRIVTPMAQFCYAKIFNLWIFAFLLFQYKNQFYIILSDEREYYKCALLKYRHSIYKVKVRYGNINFSVTLIFFFCCAGILIGRFRPNFISIYLTENIKIYFSRYYIVFTLCCNTAYRCIDCASNLCLL